jgi:hypothetical protein
MFNLYRFAFGTGARSTRRGNCAEPHFTGLDDFAAAEGLRDYERSNRLLGAASGSTPMFATADCDGWPPIQYLRHSIRFEAVLDGARIAGLPRALDALMAKKNGSCRLLRLASTHHFVFQVGTI